MQRARKLLKTVALVLPLMTLMVSAIVALAAEEEGAGYAKLGKAIGAALAIGLSGIGAGYAVAVAAAAAASATAEKPEIFGRLLIYVVLGEGIAIYGLLTAIIIAMII
ncbi:MAG TPA: V-type ATP synthase subunit K [Pyrodictium sp.]|nr:V-type ATP synthase subunit K [Pyrodictium sp.]